MGIIKTDFVLLNEIINESPSSNLKVLAEKSDITQKQLLLILAGKAQPTSDEMYRLVDSLGIQFENAGEIFFSLHSK